jgi:hypothetical protein
MKIGLTFSTEDYHASLFQGKNTRMFREEFRYDSTPARAPAPRDADALADIKRGAIAAVLSAQDERRAKKLSVADATKAIEELDAAKIAGIFAHIGIIVPSKDGKNLIVDDQKSGMKIKPLLKGSIGGDQWKRVMGELRSALAKGGGELGKPLREALAQLFLKNLPALRT